jgi:transposase
MEGIQPVAKPNREILGGGVSGVLNPRQRLQFLSSYQKEEMSVADLCRAYGISRPTAYRWINRFNETGPEGLVDRSRRPHTCSHATLEPMGETTSMLRESLSDLKE